MKKNKNILVIFSCLLLLTAMLFLVAQASAATYEPLRIPNARDNEVNEMGVVFARFTGGELQKNDTVIFSLPAGFIWTTAALRADKSAASASFQTTAQWNTAAFEADYARYGTSNYFLVPSQYSGNPNGLFKGAVPALQLTRLSDNEVMLTIIDDPAPLQDCCFYIYAERVFVENGYSGNISLQVDASPGSGFGGQTSAGSTVECKPVPNVYAGIPGQKIGPIVITEAAAGRIGNGQSLTLRLPEGARWVKLAEDSANNLKINISESPLDNGRTAEFRFTGNSSTAAVLTLADMEVALEPGKRGNLIVKVSGTAGLSGELTAAKIILPVAVFTVGETKFDINGAENTMDVAPYVKDDRVYLPVRYFARATGITESDIIWSQGDQSIEIRKGGRVVKLKIGSNVMYVDNTPTLMDVAPEIVAPGRTMLPLSWVAQALGFDVYWDSGAHKAYISSLNN